MTDNKDESLDLNIRDKEEAIRNIRGNSSAIKKADDILNEQISRRKFLQIIGLASGGVALGALGANSSLVDKFQETKTDDYNSLTNKNIVTGQATAPENAEDVTAYGAVGDGNSDDTAAIRQAANEAAPDGTVYLPSGTYLVGTDRESPFRYPSDGSWNNLTWMGEDPTNTELVMASGKDSFHAFFRNENNDIEGATFRNLDMDIKGSERGNIPGGSSCILFNSGSGKIEIRNCIFRDPMGGNVRTAGDLGLEVYNSEFYESGNVDPDKGGHSITFIPESSQQCNVSGCLFKGDKGSTLKVGREQVGVDWASARFENCYIEGPRLVKLDPENDTTVFDRINFNCIETELFQQDGIATNVNTGTCGALEITNSVLRGPMYGSGISIGSASDVPADAMDYIEIDNVDIIEPDQGNTGSAGDRNATGFFCEVTEHRGGTLYIENVGSNNDGDAVWFTKRGPTNNNHRGSYDEIRHSGTRRLGDTAGVTIGNEVSGGSRLNPDVPSEEEVGVNSGSSGSTDGGSDSGSGTDSSGTGSIGSEYTTKEHEIEFVNEGSEPVNYYFRVAGSTAGTE